MIRHIDDVYLRNSIAQCLNGFDPKYDQELENLVTQTKHGIKQAQLVQVDEAQWLVRVYIELGARLVDPRVTDEIESVRAFIEAEYVTEYTVDEELQQACIDEFALKMLGVSHHLTMILKVG